MIARVLRFFFPLFFFPHNRLSRLVELVCPVCPIRGFKILKRFGFPGGSCSAPFLLLGWLCLVSLVAARADTWADVERRAVLRWGNDAEGGAPYVYHPPNDPNRLIGFEVDFAEALCTRLGVKSQFVQFGWNNLVPGLQQGGNYDVIIAGLERSSENLAKIRMSRPYFAFGQQLVTRADRIQVLRLADLGLGSVGVLSGSSSFRLASSQPGLQIRVYDDNVNYFRDLELGRLDAVLTDTPIAQVNLAGNAKLRAAGPPFEFGYYAVGLRTGDTNLLNCINGAIEALLADGTLEQVYTRYGLWNAEQSALTAWKPASSELSPPLGISRSALREWRTYLPILLRAAVTTVWVTCAGMTLAVAWGALLALARQYAPKPLQWAAIAYIEVFRGTPLLLQLYFIYFGLAQQFGWNLSAGFAAVLALGLNYAATEAENYRAGLEAVPLGQTEAALALGMTRAMALRRVILPQALRISLPSVTNDFIAMFKDSSIVSVIGLMELTKEYQIRGLDTGDYIGVGLMTAAIYFVLSYAASLGVAVLERRLR